MLWRLVVAVLLVAAAVVAAGISADEPSAPRRASAAPAPEGHPAGCARQSIASFAGAFTSRDNLVVGPLALIGAGRFTDPSVVKEYDGNKFPALVRAGRTVTVKVARGSASLFYAKNGGGVLTETRVADGDRAVTFRACGPRRAGSEADGDPVTFWSGFVLVAEPMCVRLKVWVGSARTPRRAAIPLGRRCSS
jgi:hypothetical protein